MIPTRSRRCDGERFKKCHWVKLGRLEVAMNLSQKTCLFSKLLTLRETVKVKGRLVFIRPLFAMRKKRSFYFGWFVNE